MVDSALVNPAALEPDPEGLDPSGVGDALRLVSMLDSRNPNRRRQILWGCPLEWPIVLWDIGDSAFAVDEVRMVKTD